LDAEDIEVRGGDAHALQFFGLAGAGQRDGAAEIERGHVFEDGVLVLPVEEVERGDAIAAAARRLLPNHHDAVRVAVGQGLEQHAVHETEDGGVGSDAEREGQQRDDGEAGRAAQRADGVTHGCSLDDGRRVRLAVTW
jgi:hypothetical protein